MSLGQIVVNILVSVRPITDRQEMSQQLQTMRTQFKRVVGVFFIPVADLSVKINLVIVLLMNRSGLQIHWTWMDS
jgi:hypothetical protein